MIIVIDCYCGLVDRASFCDAVDSIYSRQKEYPGRWVKSPWPSPSNWMVSPVQGVWGSLHSVHSSSYRLVRNKSERKAPVIHLQFWFPWCGSRSLSSIYGIICVPTPFPPSLIRQVLLRVLLLTEILLVLVDPCWPQKEWFTDLELPQVWNLPVQPHMHKFYCVLGTLRLPMWTLQGFLS